MNYLGYAFVICGILFYCLNGGAGAAVGNMLIALCSIVTGLILWLNWLKNTEDQRPMGD